jgi:hypothetical protein
VPDHATAIFYADALFRNRTIVRLAG